MALERVLAAHGSGRKADHVTHFACAELHGARLSPSACAARHSGAVSLVCERCPVGAAHAMEQRPARCPDGTPLVRLELQRATAEAPAYTPGALLLRPICETPARLRERARRGQQASAAKHQQRRGWERGRTRGGRTYTHDGRTLTIAQWAAEPDVIARGIRRNTLAVRLSLGWTPERALTEPARARSRA